MRRGEGEREGGERERDGNLYFDGNVYLLCKIVYYFQKFKKTKIMCYCQ